jgi:uncharacterized protein
MYFVIYALDVPGSPIREQLGRQHRAYLDAQAAIIFAAGPLLDDADDTMIGSHLIIECDSRAQLDVFLADEPYFNNGLFARVDIRRWDRRR